MTNLVGAGGGGGDIGEAAVLVAGGIATAGAAVVSVVGLPFVLGAAALAGVGYAGRKAHSVKEKSHDKKKFENLLRGIDVKGKNMSTANHM